MLSSAKQQIGPISPVLVELDGEVTAKGIGSWGIVYLICGALAGQSKEWTSTVLASLDTSQRAQIEWLSGVTPEWLLAYDFRTFILEHGWSETGLLVASSRLADLEASGALRFSSDQSKAQSLAYFRLAISLNSLSDLRREDLTPIRHWAEQHDEGWATLFYAAGILLSRDDDFPWPTVAAGLLIASHSARSTVEALFDHYAELGRS